MTAEAKIAQGRMTLLQLAERLRNVSEACRRRGVSRSQFYEYKRAFQENGLQGLIDRPPVPRSFPGQTPSEVKEKVIALSVVRPAWGRKRISYHLRLEGISVSASTVRNIWLKEGLETRYKRILKLEQERFRSRDRTHGRADKTHRADKPLFQGAEGGEPLSRISLMPGCLRGGDHQGGGTGLSPGRRRYLRLLCLREALQLEARGDRRRRALR